jgi:micrococcal nuclease
VHGASKISQQVAGHFVQHIIRETETIQGGGEMKEKLLGAGLFILFIVTIILIFQRLAYGEAKLMVDYRYNCQLGRVIDGDTVDLECDLGFNIWIHERFRLDGINAPERGKKGGKEATEFLRELLTNAKVLEVESKKQEKYGRWLGAVYADDQNVSDLMLEHGHAKRYGQ